MISVIVAVAQNGVIGCANRLIWNISEDLRRFKAITSGHPIIMGRKTYESIGRPLPNRTNVIITRSKDYKAEGCRVAGSIKEAIEMFDSTEELFIIGGGEIYEQLLPIANKMYITTVHHDYEGDTIFPKWDPEEWVLIDEKHHLKGEKFEYQFSFCEYVRK